LIEAVDSKSTAFFVPNVGKRSLCNVFQQDNAVAAYLLPALFRPFDKGAYK